MAKKQQKLIILSGLSGSGKTIALHTLEDAGFYCIDNLPVGLLGAYIENFKTSKPAIYDLIAVSIDARSGINDMLGFDDAIEKIKNTGVNLEIIYLTTDTKILLSRFSETRRKHPLTRKGLPLIEAIHLEKNILKNIFSKADLLIDTTGLNIHQLRKQISSRVLAENQKKLALLFQSFGFKHGTPTDTDFIFDVRCLPNPHWEPTLRESTGRDQTVIDYLESHEDVKQMFDSIQSFVSQWVGKFEAENRSYVTVSIGCTGGRHRSVYLTEKLGRYFKQKLDNVSVRHRELK